jgi:hypothetical protein
MSVSGCDILINTRFVSQIYTFDLHRGEIGILRLQGSDDVRLCPSHHNDANIGGQMIEIEGQRQTRSRVFPSPNGMINVPLSDQTSDRAVNLLFLLPP